MKGHWFRITIGTVCCCLAVLAISSHDVSAQNVLFLGSADTPTGGADGAVMTLLESTYGAGNVTYMNSSATAAGDELAYDVLILSSTPGSGTMRNKFQDSPVGIVNWEEAIARNAAGEFYFTSGDRPKSNGTQLTITDNTHPITAGLALGPADIVTAESEFWSTAGPLGPGISVLATGPEDRAAVMVADAGAELLDGVIAPGRRVMLPLTDSTFNTATDIGEQLLLNSVSWAAVPEPSSALLIVLSGLLLLGIRRR